MTDALDMLSQLRERERRLIEELEKTREQIRLECLCEACNKNGKRCGRLKQPTGKFMDCRFCSLHAERRNNGTINDEKPLKAAKRNGILVYTRDGKEVDVAMVLSGVVGV